MTDPKLARIIKERAREVCEYCHLPQSLSILSFEIDHVIALKHGGETIEQNLALACFYCNRYKGSNIAGLDPNTGQLVPLFHPRTNLWQEHFEWQEVRLLGRTPIGRATIEVLKINHLGMGLARQSLLQEGVFPY